MQKKELVLRERRLSSTDLEFIKAILKEHGDKGRSHISRVLCLQWDWRQPNGWLKDRACRDILLALERLGYLRLPPRQAEKNNVRFLILPWVRIKYLASRVLAANIRVLPTGIGTPFMAIPSFFWKRLWMTADFAAPVIKPAIGFMSVKPRAWPRAVITISHMAARSRCTSIL